MLDDATLLLICGNQRVAGSSPARFTTITNVYAGIYLRAVLGEGSRHLGSIKVPLLARLGGFRAVHELTAYREIGAAVAPFPSHPTIAPRQRCCTCQILSRS